MMNVKVLFFLMSFAVSEILPFFPSFQSNGIVHSITMLLGKKYPSLKHDCASHPPVKSITESFQDISHIKQNIPHKNKDLVNMHFTGDIDNKRKFLIHFRIMKK